MTSIRRPPPSCSVLSLVVRDVTVKQPLARVPRLPDHIVALPGPYVYGDLEDPSGLLNRVAVGLDDGK